MPNTLKQNVDRVVAAKTAIGNAIVAQGGTVSVGDGLEEFAADIGTISTGVDPEPINAVLEEANDELEAALGGGSTPVPKGQVNFYDYDGTLVKSMSSAQFRGLESMPTNPSHEGLTAQGWNWSLSDAKAYVTTYGSLNIGQQYVTDDGKTRIYVNLPEGRISPVLKMYLNSNTELDIDWGDGSAHSAWTTTSADYKSERHNYPDKGDYVIAITVVSGSFILQSQSTSYNSFFTDGKNSANSSDRVYLNSIQKIEIGTGVTEIGNQAFQNCHSLSSITIPNTVGSIGEYVFQYCYSLSSITIPNSITSIKGYTFCYCSSLSSITIPNTITTIRTYAFQYCYSLSAITIPNTVTSIGTYAFQYCYSLSSVTIPNGVTTITNNTFNNCYSLSSVFIPNSVTIIGDSVFSGFYSLSSITIPNSVNWIGLSAFNSCYSLSSITIPNGVTEIGNYAFQYCYSLSSITIPNTVTSIGNYAFSGCYSLSSITIPNTITTIGNNAFQYCYSLSSITIPSSVTTIGSSAFSSCYSLSSITIPSSITTIKGSTFSSCNSMDYIKFIGTTPPTVTNSSAWTNVSTSTVICAPMESISVYKTATNYPNPSSYNYVGYATYASGDSLPSSIPGYSLTWYATIKDWIAETNPITVGNGNDVYVKIAIVTNITRETDFVNNITTRSTNAIEALNVYRNMKRCNVADDGTINAYDGDLTYTEGGSNGQVMVKVDKFYYKLDVSQTGDLDGVNIRKGRWSIADTKLDNSYKLHPAFLAADGVTELDYFLYSAFEAVGQDENGVYNTSYNTTAYKLGSVGGNTYKPTKSLTRSVAQTMATNRGTGWFSAGVKQTMAIQMLMSVEYGFNSQIAIGQGIVSDSAVHNTGQTVGSTTSGTQNNQKTAVNYRGIENFWGNIWTWIDGLNVSSYTPYVCDTYTFVDDTTTGYTQIGFNIPATNFITALGYDANNDWIMLPSEASSTEEPSGPIGDRVNSDSGLRVVYLGGRWAYGGSKAGAFYWDCTESSSDARTYTGARIMYIPA